MKKLVLKCFLSVLVLYLVFTPVFCVYNLTNGSPWLFVAANAGRFLAVLATGVFYNRQSRIDRDKQEQSAIFVLLCCLSMFAVFLHFMEIPEKIYGTLSASFGIYEIFADNLFLIVLLEQLFNSSLITNALICSAVAFFKPIHIKAKA